MENRTNGVSIGGMVVGIIALLLSFIPCIGVVGGPLALVGLILSLIGYRSAKDSGGPTTIGIVGMALSVVAIIVAIAWGTFMARAGNDATEPLNIETCEEVLQEMERSVEEVNTLKKQGEEAGLGALSKVVSMTTRIVKIQAKAEELECNQDSTFKARMEALTDEN